MTAALLLAGITVVALNAYVVLAGADFGGGVWDLLASGPRRPAQRMLIAHAIGPVWEANHVWLILVIVLLFTGFPSAFQLLSIRLNLPLTGVLIGIVLRGSAFAFRGYGGDRDEVQRRWGRVFAVASLVTPLLLGVAVGAIASGALGQPPNDAGFYAGYMAPWLTPFSLVVGALTLVCFAFLAAVYLTLETDEPALQEDFRRRALIAGVAVGAVAAAALLLSRATAPMMQAGLMRSRWALPFQLCTGLAAVTTLAALWQRRFHLARLGAAAQVSLILWGWAWSQFPYLVPPVVSIGEGAAPPATLHLVLGALALGGVILIPSLVYLFRIFKSRPHGAAA